MRKQTKLVAVLSAAALLALGASMTSFAAGWEKDDEGTWHYYDKEGDLVTDEWKKDGGKWFYLNEDGDMVTDEWVDDEYYVGEDGAMMTSAWIKTYNDNDFDDPEEDEESWYYFNNKGKKVSNEMKKINGKYYFFDVDGKMRDGWYQEGNNVYYLGDEDDGARASGWLWLEAPEVGDVWVNGHTDVSSGDKCDDEGWYYFGSDGKMYKDATNKKKINGKYYYFNEHGQMLYEWINTRGASGNSADGASGSVTASPAVMEYANEVEDGSRAAGWYEIAGAEDLGKDTDTDWYYFKKGAAKKAERTNDYLVTGTDNQPYYRAKIKIDGKYFCFDENGAMQTGLQKIKTGASTYGVYFFDDNGYMKTGKVTADDANDDTFNFYFSKKNHDLGRAVSGIKDGYLYVDGQRVEADDDYAIFSYGGANYLVNTNGKVQKATSRVYELDGGVYYAKVNSNGVVTSVSTQKDSGFTTSIPSSLINAGGLGASEGYAWEG